MASPSRSALLDAMLATPVMASVPRRDLRELIEEGSIRRVPLGTYLYLQEDRATEIWFLFEGRIELSSFSASGHRGLHTTLEPPQFVGELGVLAEGRHTSRAIALEESLVWTAPAPVFIAFLAEHADASLVLLRALARQVQAHESLVDDLLFLDLKGRVAKRLLGLVAPTPDDLPADGAIVPAIVTHADLASLAGGSRENVTRILSDFQKRGIVRRAGRRYVLANIAALRRLAGM